MDYGSHIPLILLYLETHFRFSSLIPNLLYKPHPEVIFDIPRRVNPDAGLPVLLLMNDIHQFPAHLHQVSFTTSQPGTAPRLHSHPDCEQFRLKHPFDHQCAVYLFTIAPKDLPKGEVFVTCKADLTINGKKHFVLNDNLPGSSRFPFTSHIATHPLPGSNTCLFGDMHVHSQFSQSHVEFGPPLAAIDAMASSNGLDFSGITDHSYDLACSMDDYLLPDTSGRRWDSFRKEVADPSHLTVLIPGEEISCLNTRGRVVHLCGFGLNTLIPGSFDGARKGRHHAPTLTIPEAVDAINRQKGVAAAAHPGARNGLLARLLLRRGKWTEGDINDSLGAFQGINEGFDLSWRRAKRLWLAKLAQGVRIPLIAGNDAHGDFNRYRAVNLPMVSMQEQSDRFFGQTRTGLYTRDRSVRGILDCIRKGATFVTSGPALGICREGGLEQSVIGKAVIQINRQSRLFAMAASTPEFGALRLLRVLNGNGETGVEKIVLEKRFTANGYDGTEPIDLTNISGKGYLRAEVLCESRDHGVGAQGYTSPCYYAG